MHVFMPKKARIDVFSTPKHDEHPFWVVDAER